MNLTVLSRRGTGDGEQANAGPVLAVGAWDGEAQASQAQREQLMADAARERGLPAFGSGNPMGRSLGRGSPGHSGCGGHGRCT